MTHPSLLERIRSLRTHYGGKITLQNVDTIWFEMMPCLKETLKEDEALFHEMEALTAYLRYIKNMSATSGYAASAVSLQEAMEEVGEIRKASEEITNKIMDCCDQMQQILARMTSKEDQQPLLTALNGIVESCTFQDICGQRLSKIKQCLTAITLPSQISTSTTSANESEKGLLNGPQSTDAAPSQEDVDKLFDSLPSKKQDPS